MSIPNPIKHVCQPDNISCTSACLAMLTGIPIQQILNEFHIGWTQGKQITPIQYLTEKRDAGESDVVMDLHLTYGDTLWPGGVYLLTVPSLNTVGHFHHIVFDWRDDENPLVLDPNQGRSGKRYFTHWDEAESELTYPLGSWIIDATIC